MNIKNFWSKVKKEENSCWEWTGYKLKQGYGRFSNILTHRLSYILKYGEISNNICVLHKCDNPSCVNPDHLFLGTRKDNNLDMVSKGRNHIPLGEKNPRSKLNYVLVEKIREEYSLGKIYQHELAKKYGVSQPVISKITRNERWINGGGLFK